MRFISSFDLGDNVAYVLFVVEGAESVEETEIEAGETYMTDGHTVPEEQENGEVQAKTVPKYVTKSICKISGLLYRVILPIALMKLIEWLL